MNWFTGKSTQSPAPQPQPQPNQQQGNQSNQQPNQQPNNNPQPGNPNASSNEPADPLAIYNKMFDNAPDSDKPPAFSIDPKVMDQVVSSQDFMRGIDPDLMQKAMGGDAKSFMEVIQATSRNAYRASIEHGGVLTDKFVGSSMQYQGKQLPGQLKGHLTEQSLAANTPNFKNPVVKKQLTEIAQRLSRQHPDSSPQEIADMSRKYVTDLMAAMQPEDPNKGKVPGEQDWGSYFDDEPGN